MKELAHEQELAHSNLAGVGWGGWGHVTQVRVDLHVQVVQTRSTCGMAQAALLRTIATIQNMQTR